MKERYLIELERVQKEHERLNAELIDPELLKDLAAYSQKQLEIKKIEQKNSLFEQWKQKKRELEEWKSIASEGEIGETIEKEISNTEEKIQSLERKIEAAFEKKKEEKKNLIVEIRGAAGGDEANLFAKDIVNAYLKTAKKKRWKIEILGQNKTKEGGYAFFSFLIKANKDTDLISNESGVHRVQRIPKTESQGRIHTSTITVAVLKEMENKEFPIAEKDLRIDSFKSSGAGGQHVNTTDSAIRIVHIPTGVTVSCQEGRSQHDNKDKAMKIMRARVFEIQRKKEEKEETEERRKQVGGGDRSEKIRTYNYQQNRITDHRYGITLKGIERIMNGEIDTIWKKIEEEQDKR